MHRPVSLPHAVTPLTAVSYVRVSTLSQATRGGARDGFSIPAQQEANKRHAYSLGALVVAEFIERGVSARSADRAELRRMLDYVAERRIDLVIVHKLDRLARNRADDIHITRLLAEAGTRLVSTTEAISDSPDGRLVHGIMASIAEFYSHNLATEVKKGMRQKARQGGTVGRAPLGYLNQRARDDSGHDTATVIVDHERAEHITWAFTTYATGTWSMAQIADELTARGLTPRPMSGRSPTAITSRTVRKILTNPYYKGVVRFDGIDHPGNHQPLIDPITWAHVQDMIEARRSGERSRIHTHYLKSTICCYQCGRRLLVHHATSKNGTVYDYFTCSGRQASQNSCDQNAIPIAVAETRVHNAYRTLTLTPAVRERIEAIATARLRREHDEIDTRRHELTEALTENDTHQAKLLDAHYADAIPHSLFLDEQHRLNRVRAELQTDLANTHANHDELRQQLTEALDLLQDGYNLYTKADEPLRQQLNKALFRRILIGPEPDQITIELNEPYQQLHDDASTP